MATLHAYFPKDRLATTTSRREGMIPFIVEVTVTLLVVEVVSVVVCVVGSTTTFS